MIIPATGAIRLADGLLGPGTEKQAFLHSQLGKTAVLQTHAGCFASYGVQARLVDNTLIYLTVHFFNERLTGIWITCALPGDGDTWAHWSALQEEKRLNEHHRRLGAALGRPPYEFTWGSACSVYDDKVGGSLIKLRYTGHAVSKKAARQLA